MYTRILIIPYNSCNIRFSNNCIINYSIKNYKKGKQLI